MSTSDTFPSFENAAPDAPSSQNTTNPTPITPCQHLLHVLLIDIGTVECGDLSCYCQLGGFPIPHPLLRSLSLSRQHGASLAQRVNSLTCTTVLTSITSSSAVRYASDSPSRQSVRTIFRTSSSWSNADAIHSFHVNLPVSRLSSQALISVNTYTSSAKGPDGGKAGSAMGEAEDLAGRAWSRLGGRGENQAVVFL